MVVAVVTYCVLGFYVLMVVVFAAGWLRLSDFKPKSSMKPPVSLVVCCKNEADNLPRLLASVAAQTHPDFEVVFANDHSVDATEQILTDFCAKYPFARYINTEKTGKKQALREAIATTRHDIVCCTDADCTLQPDHLATVAGYFAEQKPDMLLGGVRMAHDKSLFQQLQALEFASLVASGAGACGAGVPIMCNGANMAFTRQIWDKHSAQLHDELLSGDDVFLLHAVKKNHGKIAFLKHRSAVVTTQPQRTLCQFLAQRSRWASKTTNYTDAATIVAASCVFGVQMLIFALFIGIFWEFGRLFLCVFLAKFLTDTLFLALYLPFVRQEHLLVHTLALSVLYPLYVLWAAFGGLVRKVRW